MKQTTISIETARAMYERGGTAKEFILKNFTETELQKPSYPKQTAVTLLFQEFRALSEVMRKAGDEKNANLIDCLCEREEVAKAMEKEQMIEFATDTHNLNYYKNKSFRKEAEDYYNETYGGTKN